MFTLGAQRRWAHFGLWRVACLLSVGWALMALPAVAQPAATAQAQPPGPPSEAAVLIDYSVLVIRQTRQIHDQIPEIILRVQQGDDHWTGVGSASGGMGGMGGMGTGGMGGGASGGFGGGFF